MPRPNVLEFLETVQRRAKVCGINDLMSPPSVRYIIDALPKEYFDELVRLAKEGEERRDDAERFKHLMDAGMFIGTDEDGNVFLGVGLQEHNLYHEIPATKVVAQELDNAVVTDKAKVLAFIDELRKLTEEQVAAAQKLLDEDVEQTLRGGFDEGFV